MLVLALAVVVWVIDQISKQWAVSTLQGEPPTELLGGLLTLTFVRNSGAAFSLLSGQTWVFTVIGTVIVVAVLWFMTRVRSMWWALALGLVLGGAVGNLTDRWVRPPGAGQGHVVDFLELPNWPVFNVADMAVVGGAVLVVGLSVLGVPDSASGWQRHSPQGSAPEDDGHE